MAWKAKIVEIEKVTSPTAECQMFVEYYDDSFEPPHRSPKRSYMLKVEEHATVLDTVQYWLGQELDKLNAFGLVTDRLAPVVGKDDAIAEIVAIKEAEAAAAAAAQPAPEQPVA